MTTLARLAALAAACLLAACGEQGARGDHEGVLRVGVGSLPVSQGDPFRGNGRPGTLVWYALFDGLTQLDEQGRLTPALALSWRSVSPTLWRFELRPGVRFSNGRPFDAEAAARVLNWTASPAGRRTVVGNELRTLVAARATGPLTLEIVTKGPDPIMPKRLVAAQMVEPDLWTKLGPDGFARAPVGTGPFQLKTWDQRRRRLVLTRNPHDWRSSALKGLEFVELPDAAVRTQALLSRDVDIAPVELEEIDRLRARGVTVRPAPSMSMMSVAFRTERPTASPLQDQRVRQALNYAVDKEAMVRLLLRGLGRPAGQPAPRGSAGHDPAIAPYPYDPARARRLLAEAGYPDGFPLTIAVQVNAWPADSLIFQAMAHDLRQVGVRPTLRIIQLPEYLKNLQTNGWTVDAFGASWNSAPYGDATRPMESFSCKRPKPFFCDKPLAGQLGAATVIMEDGEREAALHKVAAAYHDAAPALFLVETVDLWASAPGVAGVRIRNRTPIYEAIRLMPIQRQGPTP